MTPLIIASLRLSNSLYLLRHLLAEPDDAIKTSQFIVLREILLVQLAELAALLEAIK